MELSGTDTTGSLYAKLIPLLALLLLAPLQASDVPQTNYTEFQLPADFTWPFEVEFLKFILFCSSIFGPTLTMSLVSGVFGFCVWAVGYYCIGWFRHKVIESITGFSLLGLFLMFARALFLRHKLDAYRNAYLDSLDTTRSTPDIINSPGGTEVLYYVAALLFVLLLVAVFLLSARVLAVEVGFSQPSNSGWLALFVATVLVLMVALFGPFFLFIIEQWCQPTLVASTTSPSGPPASGPIASFIDWGSRTLVSYLTYRTVSPPDESEVDIENPFVDEGDTTARYLALWVAERFFNDRVGDIIEHPLVQAIGDGTDVIITGSYIGAVPVLSTAVIAIAIYRLARRGGNDFPDID